MSLLRPMLVSAGRFLTQCHCVTCAADMTAGALGLSGGFACMAGYLVKVLMYMARLYASLDASCLRVDCVEKVAAGLGLP